MSKFLKPAEGRTVHLPDGTLVPADGMEIEDSLFRRRRLADGDLIDAAPALAVASETNANTAGDDAAKAKPKGGK